MRFLLSRWDSPAKVSITCHSITTRRRSNSYILRISSSLNTSKNSIRLNTLVKDSSSSRNRISMPTLAQERTIVSLPTISRLLSTTTRSTIKVRIEILDQTCPVGLVVANLERAIPVSGAYLVSIHRVCSLNRVAKSRSRS